MRITDLKAQLLRYELKTEDYDVVDPRFTWDSDKKQYLNSEGQDWHAAGSPTVSKTGPRLYMHQVEALAEAQNLFIQCPKCTAAGEQYIHGVHVPFADRGAPDEAGPHSEDGKPIRWNVSGTSSLADLTITPSILIIGGCGWHGYITDGSASII